MSSFCVPRRGGFGIACRLLGMVTGVCLATHVEAADISWINPSGGIFSTVSNWSDIPLQPDRAPGPNDIAHFGLTPPPSPPFVPLTLIYTVNFTANAINDTLVVEDDFVTFNLNGRVYSTIGSSANLIGNVPGRPGSLSVEGGGILDFNGVVFVGFGGGSGNLSINQVGSSIVQSDFFARIGASASSGTVNVDGIDSEWIHAGELSVGWGGTGTMNITDAGLVQNNTGIIADGGGAGTVTLSNGGQWTNSLDLIIGNGGNGTLNINSRGRVENVSGHVGFVAGHTGTVNVDGELSRWFNSGSLFVGDLGSGTMNITGGGDVRSVGGAVGAAAGASGSVTISGADIHGFSSSWFNSGDLNVGGVGMGTLDIIAGGRVSTDNGFIGRDSGSMGEVNVDGANSFWGNNTNLTVGDAGVGALNITAGGRVGSILSVSNDGVIGDDAGSTGTVTISGDGSQWDMDSLSVGDLGHGTVNVTAGGHLDTENAVIGVAMGSIGEVTVDGVGSMWTNNGLIFVSSFGPGTGTLTVTNGGTVAALGGLSVRLQGILRGDSQIIGNVSNIGSVDPGASISSIGTLSIDGNYNQGATGNLRIEMASTASVDKLAITGSAALAGTLDIDETIDFLPSAGDNYDILDAASVTGAFATIDLPTLPAGLMWNASQLYTAGVLSVALAGDYNLNGTIDAADHVVWRKTLGQMGAGLAADGNGNGTIDPGDYNIWLAHFGETVGSGAALGPPFDAAVPEPTSAVLLGLGIIAMAMIARPANYRADL